MSEYLYDIDALREEEREMRMLDKEREFVELDDEAVDWELDRRQENYYINNNFCY